MTTNQIHDDDDSGDELTPEQEDKIFHNLYDYRRIKLALAVSSAEADRNNTNWLLSFRRAWAPEGVANGKRVVKAKPIAKPSAPRKVATRPAARGVRANRTTKAAG